MPYKTRHICTLFDISEETVRVWVNEFAEYLSPTATPGKHKQRTFTDRDMAILSLVAEYKGRGRTFAEIHFALKSGQRGVAPAIPPEQMDAITSTDRESQLAFQNQHLQRDLVEVNERLQKALGELESLRDVRDENIRLKAQIESVREHEKQLIDMVDRLTRRMEDIALQMGREVARGITEAMRGQGDSKKE